MPFTHHDLLKFNLVPRVSYLTAPWSERKMRDLWKQGCSNLGTAGWYCVRKGVIFLACAFPDTPVNKVLSEVKFEERKSTLQQKEKKDKKILPFVTQYH